MFYPQEVEKQVNELSKLFQQKEFRKTQQRMKEKGFRNGFACLFYGSPGTGKTETVYQLALQTGRSIMVVDVPQIKSKWVGDSEKNIKALFDRYREVVKHSKLAPILLFNEADAIIGKRQEGAERAVELLLAPYLAVLQPRELVPVPEEEFQLEPRPVDVDAVLCAHFRVGGEEELVSSSILVHALQSLGVPDDEPDVPLEALDIRQEAAELVHPLHPAEVGGHGVEFSVVLFRCASLPRPLARVEITQCCVLPEPAGHGESHENDGGDYHLRGVKRVGHLVLRDPQEPFLVLLDGFDVPAVEVHGLAIPIGMFA